MVQVKSRTPEEFRAYIEEQEKKGQHINISVRVQFFKVGPLAYISHLDLVRTMMKIVVRAGLPLWYTEGFNPKPKLVFSAPLSTGVESQVEYMDLRLSEIVPVEEVVEKLNRAMPPDMQVIKAYYPTGTFSDLGAIRYKIVVSSPDVSETLLSRISDALRHDTYEVEKKTKKGEMKSVDIKGQVYNVEFFIEDGKLVILATLCADPSAFLTPEYLIAYLRREAGLLTRENLMEESYTICRTDAYDKENLPFV